MGHGWSFMWWRRPPPVDRERSEPLTTLEEIISNLEAHEKIANALEECPPGTAFRWDKLLKKVCTESMPTEEMPDPIRIRIDMDILKTLLRLNWVNVDAVKDDKYMTGMALLKKCLPEMYEKHSVERGLRVSQKERIDKNISDDMYAYGELDLDDFVRLVLKTISTYGNMKNGVFYDMGCGVGNLVYAAGFLGLFSKCGGIEYLKELLDRGEKRLVKWEKYKNLMPQRMQDIDFEWNQDNFLESEYWLDGSFFLLHWATFNLEQRLKTSDLMAKCREGAICIALVQPIPSPDWETLIKDSCKCSWGSCDVYIQEKLTPARKSWT